MRYLILMTPLLVISCATGNINVTDPVSKITFSGKFTTLWSNVNFSGIKIKVSKDGSRELTLDSLNGDETTGLDSFNKMFPDLAAKSIAAGIEAAK